MRRSSLTTALLSLVIASSSAFAQNESLLDVYRRAESNDPTIREAEANYLAARERRPQARSALLPNFSLSGNQSRNYSQSNVGPGFGGVTIGAAASSESRGTNTALNVNISQPLLDIAAIRSLKQAGKVVAQAEINLEIAQQDLLIRVAEAYFNVLSTEDLLAAEVATREALSRQLEQAQRRFDVGLIAITDVQQAQAAYDNAIATEIGAQRTLATTQEFLREIVGDYVNNLLSPTDELPLIPPDPATPDEWVGAAMRQNLTLAASRIGTDIAEDNVRIIRADRLPTLSLTGGVGTSSFDQLLRQFDSNGNFLPGFPPRSGDTDSRDFAINFNMPLFTGGMNASRIKESVYQYRAAQEGLERVMRQTERQTRDAYLGVISEISRVQALRQAVESNQTALRATEAGFEVGTQTTVDVLAAQDSLRRALTNYAISRYDYIINLLRLRQAAGSLSVADIELVDSWLD